MGSYKRILSHKKFISECINAFYKYKENNYNTTVIRVIIAKIVNMNSENCPFCNKRFRHVYRHIYRAHRADIKLVCECLYEILKDMRSRYVIGSLALEKKHKCAICGKRFGTFLEAVKHVIDEHLKEEVCRCLPKHTYWCKIDEAKNGNEGK